MRGLRTKTWSICILLALAAGLALAACTGDGPTQPASCDGVGGNLLSARVDGTVFCAAAVADAPLAPGFRQIVGYSADGRMLHLVIPLTVGSFDLSPGVGIGGSYLPAVEGTTTYLTTGENGRITINELTPARARGSFEFVALGYHQDTGDALDSQVTVTATSRDEPVSRIRPSQRHEPIREVFLFVYVGNRMRADKHPVVWSTCRLLIESRWLMNASACSCTYGQTGFALT